MTKEIKKETDWLGREKDVIYENREKVGETRHETTFFGNPIDRTYDKDGNRVSETRHETTLFGTSKEATYEPGVFGNKISETRYEEGIFGGKKGVIYQNRRKIGKLKTEKGIFGGRKRVLHESGDDVDLTRRASREEPTQTSTKYSLGSTGRSTRQQNLPFQRKSELESKRLGDYDAGQRICNINDKINHMEYNLKQYNSLRRIFFFWPFSMIIDDHIMLLDEQMQAEKERMERLFNSSRDWAQQKTRANFQPLIDLIDAYRGRK